jgi:cystathionine beta-lyase/cystathionine gamma-synthase
MALRIKILAGNIINVVLFLIILLISGWLIYTSYEDVNELKDWRHGIAIVESTSIKKQFISRRTTYCPRVKVHYSFQGWQYTSTLIARCPPIKTAAMTANNRFPKGSKVNIFINPKKPTEIKHESYSLDMNFYGPLLLFFISFFGIIYSIMHTLRNFKKSC